MSDLLKEKVAVITGGASGIGAGTARMFVAEGAKVVIADLNEENGQELASSLGPNAAFKKTDMGDVEEVRDLIDFAIKTFGRIDILMNNAAFAGKRYPGLLADDLRDFHRIMSVNVLGLMTATREAAMHMSKTGGGSIINITSVGGMQAGQSLQTYGISKAAVIHFSKCSALDLGEHNIRVNCIAPANIETPMLGGAVAGDISEEERVKVMKNVRQFLISKQVLKRQGEVEDIAQAALFFASEQSRYVTGVLMQVDGGITTGTPSTGQGFAEATRPLAPAS
jgi:NAD(P)-dependent dehydrogenase (short-subunit alcohol dehydrogenase family)